MKNKLLPIFLVGALIVLGIVVFIATRSEPDVDVHSVNTAPPTPGDLRMRPTGIPGDRDDPLETIRTLTELQESTQRIAEDERAKNETMRRELDDRIQNQVDEQVEKQLREFERTLESTTRKLDTAYKTQIRKLERSIDTNKRGLDKVKEVGGRALGSLNEDFGLDGQLPGIGGASPLPNRNRMVSIRPLGAASASVVDGLPGGVSNAAAVLNPAVQGTNAGGRLLTQSSRALPESVTNRQAVNDSLARAAGDDSATGGTDRARNARRGDAVEAVYTINNGATLFTNTTMTAMMGKVPVNNSLTDPFRFKVISGTDNLAASRQHLPDGLDSIVWTGFVAGNREQSCVSGFLDTVTLVFQDGTISTTSVRATGQPDVANIPHLAYISDQWGKPCIRGQLYDNARQYLTDRVFLSALAATASAAAAAQTTTITGDQGNIVQGVTGEQRDFILSNGVAGALDETLDFYRDRLSNVVDVVYVPTGEFVTIHVDTEIAFDRMPSSRKIDHTVSSLGSFNDLD